MAKRPINPKTHYLSEGWRVFDLMNNHSVITQGMPNWFDGTADDDRIINATVLAVRGLHEVEQRHGPLSVSYGFISPEFSRAKVKYQDPNMPSHHRWDLGAAADIIVHHWVNPYWQPEPMSEGDHESLTGAPIRLAYDLDDMGIPYSRMITYSESPGICLAISADEVSGKPRKAFYENQYTGQPRVKPKYTQLSSAIARTRHRMLLQQDGLPHPWRGGGYPTHHGGGLRQLHHTFTGPYNVALDWFINERSLRKGARNLMPMPGAQDFAAVREAFELVSAAYALIVQAAGGRVPIDSGYLSRSHPDTNHKQGWAGGFLGFQLAPRWGQSASQLRELVEETLPDYGVSTDLVDDRAVLVVISRGSAREAQG